ncbi:MAG: DUF1549 and DUF1553 domain-containing protein [Planctomycetaceae bacterium]|nr:DUF1549 and DUF1553 domain-containing protein [Planctomycetaceae bacterium]
MRLTLPTLSVLMLLTPVVAEDAIRPAESIQVTPSPLRLGGANRQRQVQVTARAADGTVFDVTHQATLTVVDRSHAVLDGTTVRGVADGQTRLQVQYAGRSVEVPIQVRNFNRFPPVHFLNDIMPILSKLGCNSGGCHGKQSGQNGFRLSIFGFDPRADYDALVKEARGRRVFQASPTGSLLVAKSTNRLAHGGGARTRVGSIDHELLSQWVSQGAPWGNDNSPQIASIQIEPARRQLGARAEQQLLVTATFSNGSTRDITSAAAYASNATLIADLEGAGRIHTGSVPGEAAIMVSYMGHVATARITVPREDRPKTFPLLPVHNRIDEFVWAKLKRMGILPSPIASDTVFLRRLHLDSLGTLPSPQAVRSFLADKRPDRRQHAIDAVLTRPEFSDYWAQKWADVLLVDRDDLGERGAFEFHRWLRQQLLTNRPYDEWARELLTATGNSGRYGPVNFFRAARTPVELTRSISQAFLGIRLDCAQCHHHPFEKWGQDDFYGMAGFFKGLQHKTLGPGRELVFHSGYQPTRIPLSERLAPTRPPGGQVITDFGETDPRVRLARWVTGPKNPYFARLVANRIWKHFLGRGLVEPEDDFRSTNPATNPALLDYLADQVVAGDFDLRAVMKQVLASRVYQLSSVPNETNQGDEQNYSHFLIKRLPAAVLMDAISEVTGSPEPFEGMPRGTRAIQLWDNRLPSYFLDTFGRSERRSPCECGSSTEPTMAQTLHLMNAPEIDAKIVAPGGRIDRLIIAGAPSRRIVEQLCFSALGRGPNPRELQAAERLFAGRTPRRAAEDFLWVLLNSYDFLFVH